MVQAMFSEPCFHETIIITVPLGPSGFEKVICSMELGSFTVFVVFLCAICYTIFSPCFFFVHKTLVNAQPLSPPDFEESGAHKIKDVSSYFGAVRFRFS